MTRLCRVLDGAENRVVDAGGVSLAVTEVGERTRPAIVMIHGYPDTKEVWEPVMERLADRFHVAAYDVRGAGGSTAPSRDADYDLARLADDFAAVAAAVAPGRPVHLVGHDWGGIQGWEFATDPRFAGTIASFTSIAGPALGHAAAAGAGAIRTGRPLTALSRAWRSWYIVPLCLPGLPDLVWGRVITPGRWRRQLAAQGVASGAGYPAPTLCADGRNGARLYRRNIPPRMLRPPRLAPAQAPVQLIVPTRDRYISETYYAAAERVAPGLRRRTIDAPHWVIRTDPGQVAEWIAEFVAQTGQ